jgi:hypothetical protein
LVPIWEDSNTGGSNGGNGGGLGGRCNFRFPCNMGSYCWSHDHHPIEAKHESITCTHKKDGHKDNATATNHMGSNNFWPQANWVMPSQHDHTSYKGKSAPTDRGQ